MINSWLDLYKLYNSDTETQNKANLNHGKLAVIAYLSDFLYYWFWEQDLGKYQMDVYEQMIPPNGATLLSFNTNYSTEIHSYSQNLKSTYADNKNIKSWSIVLAELVTLGLITENDIAFLATLAEKVNSNQFQYYVLATVGELHSILNLDLTTEGLCTYMQVLDVTVREQLLAKLRKTSSFKSLLYFDIESYALLIDGTSYNRVPNGVDVNLLLFKSK